MAGKYALEVVIKKHLGKDLLNNDGLFRKPVLIRMLEIVNEISEKRNSMRMALVYQKYMMGLSAYFEMLVFSFLVKDNTKEFNKIILRWVNQ